MTRTLTQRLAIGLLGVVCFSGPLHAQTEALSQASENRLQQAQQAQQQIDTIHEQATELASDYQSTLELVDGLEIYLQLLGSQLSNQEQEMASLRKSIADAAVIERQIIPLLQRMIDGLEQFIELDVPFLREERQQRVSKLRTLLTRSGVTAAEKCRRVFEAYEIENDYGRSIEHYTAKLELGDKTFDADFLRVGRVALLFQLIGQDQVGYWQSDEKDWVLSDDSALRRAVSQGIDVARKEVSPQMVTIPVRLSQKDS